MTVVENNIKDRTVHVVTNISQKKKMIVITIMITHVLLYLLLLFTQCENGAMNKVTEGGRMIPSRNQIKHNCLKKPFNSVSK